ncbi:MAG TPA: hypothetical protein VGX70_19390, partial [Gemmataceae bacterium]|nr:hypothetical protein [Gemmataceae bacterium]
TTILLLVMFVPDGQDKRDHSEKGERETVAWGLGSPVPGLGDPDRPPPAGRITGASIFPHLPTSRARAFLDPFFRKTYDRVSWCAPSLLEIVQCVGHFSRAFFFVQR